MPKGERRSRSGAGNAVKEVQTWARPDRMRMREADLTLAIELGQLELRGFDATYQNREI
jgi:hypothetical protein